MLLNTYPAAYSNTLILLCAPTHSSCAKLGADAIGTVVPAREHHHVSSIATCCAHFLSGTDEKRAFPHAAGASRREQQRASVMRDPKFLAAIGGMDKAVGEDCHVSFHGLRSS
eukprot:653826-Rhodomonas_salina.1